MQQHITTGCEDLDHILRGGIHCGEVTEVGNFAIYLSLHVLTRIREKKAIIVNWIGLLRSTILLCILRLVLSFLC